MCCNTGSVDGVDEDDKCAENGCMEDEEPNGPIVRGVGAGSIGCSL